MSTQFELTVPMDGKVYFPKEYWGKRVVIMIKTDYEALRLKHQEMTDDEFRDFLFATSKPLPFQNSPEQSGSSAGAAHPAH